jgi:hypothetical protein
VAIIKRHARSARFARDNAIIKKRRFMVKKRSYVTGNLLKYTWLISLMCLIGLGASACTGLPSSALTPTPTTLMGILPPNGQSTEIPTALGASGTADASKVLDICALITQSEAEAVLGQPVSATTPGTDTDRVTGATLNFCTYRGTGLAVLVSREDFGSAEAAKQAMKQNLAKMLSDNTTSTIPQDGGPGDQTYWATSPNAAEFTMQKGSFIFSVLLGGNIGDPATHKEALLNLANSVAGKL